jgi:hypothetical protein
VAQSTQLAVDNYFNYFTEIEERFQQRRGTGLLLSTLDWALIETWKDAGIPVEAVLAAIDATFDKYEHRPSKTRKVNSLAYCSQEVLAAAEDMKEAAIGAQPAGRREAPGLEAEEIVAFLKRNAAVLTKYETDQSIAGLAPLRPVVAECAAALSSLADAYAIPDNPRAPHGLEDLERHLSVLEEKLLAALTMTTPEADLLRMRAEADREIGPYRGKMPGLQIEQLQKQFVNKRLFERAKMPRLSLFYM